MKSTSASPTEAAPAAPNASTTCAATAIGFLEAPDNVLHETSSGLAPISAILVPRPRLLGFLLTQTFQATSSAAADRWPLFLGG